ncbi:OmpH family outer membrane protein, partial [candidate division WOR-3 bacterium]|nr:OmpH family outer membrane protein [candidate division WOR-3 bacterium]
IDSNRILEEYRGKNELKQKLEKELAKWQEEAIAKKQKIESSIKEFDSQSLMLSEDARLRKRQDIEQLKIKYEEFIQRIWGQEGLAKQKNVELMKPFIDKVNLILQEIGEKGEYLIIFDVASTGVVYTQEGLDITEKVILELNKDFAPVSKAEEEEKTLFWVFKFEERTPEAREYRHGAQVSGYIKAGFGKTGKFKAVKGGKLQNATTEANISKKEEDFTVEDYVKIGRLAEAEIVVIGEITRVGDKVNITCKVIDVGTAKVMAEEIGSSLRGEREDLIEMADRIVSKLLPRITK